MKILTITKLVLYTVEPDHTHDKLKIGDIWTIKIGPYVLGIVRCQGDCFPGMLFEGGSIIRELLKTFPTMRRIDSFPISVRMRPDASKRHWVGLIASEQPHAT